MKIVMISDTHGQHRKVRVPEGDVLIHAGDICMSVGLRMNQVKEKHANTLDDFNDWLGELPHKHKLVIGGNHDILLEACPPDIQKLALSNATYLQDSGLTIDGVNFWGAPWTPWFGDMAFVFKSREALREKWALIPEDTHVLITHGPPYGVLDKVPRRGGPPEYTGCPELAKRVKVVNPTLHVFGHIHVAAGSFRKAPIYFCNASMANENHEVIRDPQTFEV